MYQAADRGPGPVCAAATLVKPTSKAMSHLVAELHMLLHPSAMLSSSNPQEGTVATGHWQCTLMGVMAKPDEGEQQSSWQRAGPQMMCLASHACRTIVTTMRHGCAGGLAVNEL